MTDNSRPVGIIAGEGKLPSLTARRLNEEGRDVAVCQIEDSRGRSFPDNVIDIATKGPENFGSIPDFFLDNNVKTLYLVGNVKKQALYNDDNISGADSTVQSILDNIPNKGDEHLIRAATQYLGSKGLEVNGIDSLFDDALMPTGHVCGPELTESERETMEYLKPIIKFLADREVGQSIVGKRQSVVAVEAVEGTGKLIQRAGDLAGPNCVLMKCARSDQDARYDMPVVGLDTVKDLVEIDATCLAIEAGNVIWIQQEQSKQLANQEDLSIMGLTFSDTGILGVVGNWLSV